MSAFSRLIVLSLVFAGLTFGLVKRADAQLIQPSDFIDQISRSASEKGQFDVVLPEMNFAVERIETDGYQDQIVIGAEGFINKDTPLKFFEFLREIDSAPPIMLGNEWSTGKEIRVRLSSSGGYIKEALILGQMFRNMGIDTEIEGRCFSACTYAFLGGINRFYKEGAMGVHRLALFGQELGLPDNLDGSATLLAYAYAMGADERFLQAASHYAPENIRLVTRDEALTWGLANNGRASLDVSVLPMKNLATLQLRRDSFDRGFNILVPCEGDTDFYKMRANFWLEPREFFEPLSDAEKEKKGYVAQYDEYLASIYPPGHKFFEDIEVRPQMTAEVERVWNDPQLYDDGHGENFVIISWEILASNDFFLRFYSFGSLYLMGRNEGDDEPTVLEELSLPLQMALPMNFHGACHPTAHSLNPSNHSEED
ncbi:hypothetical protein GRI89_03265 [Altererythrobacter salegens]|uniref:Uncharacterized protein n=1 Tax=Croceibacterium salegens TaxID=1737568 RepID=A0A6I4SRG3_9SPHN|nr:hypothetical protein [Croceibacterium salegens]MXO58561.1 hypothetical protein [Croceibacterium salegens]